MEAKYHVYQELLSKVGYVNEDGVVFKIGDLMPKEMGYIHSSGDIYKKAELGSQQIGRVSGGEIYLGDTRVGHIIGDTVYNSSGQDICRVPDAPNQSYIGGAALLLGILRTRIYFCPHCMSTSIREVAVNYHRCDNCGREIYHT